MAPTGLHHERWYGPAHWRHRVTVDELAALFIADIEDGIDANDYAGPVVNRTPHRAGVVKVAGSAGGPSDVDRPVFEAAAIAQRRTGVPILTHCEAGTGGLEQARLLADLGVDLEHVVLSHVDKVVDRGYHRELMATGAILEYDQSFRWGDQPNGTLQLLEWAAEDGLLGAGRAGDGRRAAGLLHGVRWLARVDLAAGRLRPAHGGARPGRGRPSPGVRGQSGTRVRLHGTRRNGRR